MVPRTHSLFVVPVRALEAPVDLPVGKWKEFDLPFIKRQTIQWVGFLVLNRSQRAVCTENGR